MSTNFSKVTIHMVSSLDGFIAKPDGDISWMKSSDHYENGVELSDEYIHDFLQKIDCYVMGSKTYEQAIALGWPYGETPVIVLTNRSLTSDRSTVKFYSGDLGQLINQQLKPIYQNIWTVGGAMLTKAFIRSDLADEIIVSIMPTIIGDGTLFFDFIQEERKLHLKDVTAYKDGMVELSYVIHKE